MVPNASLVNFITLVSYRECRFKLNYSSQFANNISVEYCIFLVITWLVPDMAEQQHDFPNQNENARISDEDVALPMIDFLTISTATNEFSFSNKIGEGGFGPVYKVL